MTGSDKQTHVFNLYFLCSAEVEGRSRTPLYSTSALITTNSYLTNKTQSNRPHSETAC